MNDFVETSRHLDTLKYDEWAQDLGIIVDVGVEKQQEKRSEGRCTVWARD